MTKKKTTSAKTNIDREELELNQGIQKLTEDASNQHGLASFRALASQDAELPHLLKQMEGLAVSIPGTTEDAWEYAVEQLNISAASRARAGFSLILLKKALPHGSFLEGLKERDIPERSARKCMSVAEYLLRASPSKRPALADLGYTKLVELARLPEESLQKLEEADEISGMTLDAIDRMSTRELQKEVRKLREELASEKETSNRMLESKSQKINELERQVYTKPTADQLRQQAEEQEKQLIQDMQMAALSARSGLAGIQSLLQGVAAERKNMPGLEDSIISEMGCLSAHLDRIFAEFGIDLPVTSPLNTPFDSTYNEFENEAIDGVVEHAETH